MIPVLVDRAGMPSPEDLPEDLGLLARRNAIELSDSRWDTDIERLVRAIEAICNDPALEEKEQVEPAPREPGKSAKVPSGDTGGFERLELRRKRQIAEHMAVARQAFEIQDFEAVLASCESAVWLDPQEPEARDLAARARTALDERQIQEWLAEAGRALEKGELAAASDPQAPERGVDARSGRSADSRADRAKSCGGANCSRRDNAASCLPGLFSTRGFLGFLGLLPKIARRRRVQEIQP